MGNKKKDAIVDELVELCGHAANYGLSSMRDEISIRESNPKATPQQLHMYDTLRNVDEITVKSNEEYKNQLH